MKVLSYEVLAAEVAPSLPQLGELVDTATLASGISIFIPLLVAFITKREASDRVKSVTNLLSVAVATVAAYLMNAGDEPLGWKSVVAVFVSALITSLASYKGAWKPLKVAPAIARATENFGVGTPVPAVNEKTRPGGEVA